MRAFLDELKIGLKRCNLFRERLLVAVSGGADSVALLRGLATLAAEFQLDLIVGHLNHRLRGTDSDDDAQWVGDLAKSLSLPCEIGVASNDLLSIARGGLEENARNIRHQFFDETAMTRGCTVIVLAHTANDQAETVLHHILRGTSLSGLRGIPVIRSTPSGLRMARPMLAVQRGFIEDYLQACGQSFRIDSTNSDIAMTRNKLRHVVLPLLRAQINPQVDAALCRLADQATEIESILKNAAAELLTHCLIEISDDSCRLDLTTITDQPQHLVREVFREVWKRQNWPLQEMGFEQWNRLVTMLATQETITLPGKIEARFHAAKLLVLRRCDETPRGLP